MADPINSAEHPVLGNTNLLNVVLLHAPGNQTMGRLAQVDQALRLKLARTLQDRLSTLMWQDVGEGKLSSKQIDWINIKANPYLAGAQLLTVLAIARRWELTEVRAKDAAYLPAGFWLADSYFERGSCSHPFGRAACCDLPTTRVHASVYRGLDDEARELLSSHYEVSLVKLTTSAERKFFSEGAARRQAVSYLYTEELPVGGPETLLAGTLVEELASSSAPEDLQLLDMTLALLARSDQKSRAQLWLDSAVAEAKAPSPQWLERVLAAGANVHKCGHQSFQNTVTSHYFAHPQAKELFTVISQQHPNFFANANLLSYGNYERRWVELFVELGLHVVGSSNKFNQRTVLHDVIWTENPSIDGLRRLIELGENLEAKDTGGRTPLQYAVTACPKQSVLGVAGMLAELGADVHVTDTAGRSLVHLYCAEASSVDPRVLGELCRLTAAANLPDAAGKKPMRLLVKRMRELPFQEALEAARVLLAHGASLWDQDSTDKSPEVDGTIALHIAAGLGQQDLLDNWPGTFDTGDYDTGKFWQGPSGAVSVASVCLHADIVDRLLAAGVPMNLTHEHYYPRTPIRYLEKAMAPSMNPKRLENTLRVLLKWCTELGVDEKRALIKLLGCGHVAAFKRLVKEFSVEFGSDLEEAVRHQYRPEGGSCLHNYSLADSHNLDYPAWTPSADQLICENGIDGLVARLQASPGFFLKPGMLRKLILKASQQDAASAEKILHEARELLGFWRWKALQRECQEDNSTSFSLQTLLELNLASHSSLTHLVELSAQAASESGEMGKWLSNQFLAQGEKPQENWRRIKERLEALSISARGAALWLAAICKPRLVSSYGSVGTEDKNSYTLLCEELASWLWKKSQSEADSAAPAHKHLRELAAWTDYPVLQLSLAKALIKAGHPVDGPRQSEQWDSLTRQEQEKQAWPVDIAFSHGHVELGLLLLDAAAPKDPKHQARLLQRAKKAQSLALVAAWHRLYKRG